VTGFDAIAALNAVFQLGRPVPSTHILCELLETE